MTPRDYLYSLDYDIYANVESRQLVMEHLAPQYSELITQRAFFVGKDIHYQYHNAPALTDHELACWTFICFKLDLVEDAKIESLRAVNTTSITADEILVAIRAGRVTFSGMVGYFSAHTRTGPTGWRKLDRELQKLRRRGVIHFRRKTGWELSSPGSITLSTPVG